MAAAIVAGGELKDDYRLSWLIHIAGGYPPEPERGSQGDNVLLEFSYIWGSHNVERDLSGALLICQNHSFLMMIVKIPISWQGSEEEGIPSNEIDIVDRCLSSKKPRSRLQDSWYQNC